MFLYFIIFCLFLFSLSGTKLCSDLNSFLSTYQLINLPESFTLSSLAKVVIFLRLKTIDFIFYFHEIIDHGSRGLWCKKSKIKIKIKSCGSSS